MDASRELQEYQLERLESLINQWAFAEDEWEVDPVAALREIKSSTQSSEQVARLQGGLGEMRETLANWMKKPSVALPAVAIALGSLYHLTESQMTLSDLEYMRDVSAIGQAEFEQRYDEAKNVANRGKELTLGLLGIGGATAAAMNGDRIKAFLTGKSAPSMRKDDGANPSGDRLGARLTDGEFSKLKEVMHDFYSMAQTGNESARDVTGKKLLAAIDLTEREVASGEASAGEIMARLSEIHERIQSINTYNQARGIGMTSPMAGTPSL